jgi:hypothetical protein
MKAAHCGGIAFGVMSVVFACGQPGYCLYPENVDPQQVRSSMLMRRQKGPGEVQQYHSQQQQKEEAAIDSAHSPERDAVINENTAGREGKPTVVDSREIAKFRSSSSAKQFKRLPRIAPPAVVASATVIRPKTAAKPPPSSRATSWQVVLILFLGGYLLFLTAKRRLQ